LEQQYDEPLSNLGFNCNLGRYIAECSAAGFSHGTPLAKLSSRSTFVTLNEAGGRAPKPAEAWLRVAECSSELPDADADAEATPSIAQELQNLFSQVPGALRSVGSQSTPETSNSRKPKGLKHAAGVKLEQPEPLQRFFTAPMVGGGGCVHGTHLVGMFDSLPPTVGVTRYDPISIWKIDMGDRTSMNLDIDMGCGLMIWEMTVSIWSSSISIWDIFSPADRVIDTRRSHHVPVLMCCVPCFTGGSYSGGSSGSDVDTWVDDGGRSESIAASYLSHPSFTKNPQSPMVGRCRLTVSKPVLKAPVVSALEAEYDKQL